jgi:hypothetical protein
MAPGGAVMRTVRQKYRASGSPHSGSPSFTSIVPSSSVATPDRPRAWHRHGARHLRWRAGAAPGAVWKQEAVLRFALPILTTLALLLLGCSSGDTAPTTPSPSPPAPVSVAPYPPAPTLGATASFWAIVVPQGGGGVCIVGARVEIVAGQAVGQSGTMPEVCDVWWVNGAFFRGLTVGVEMTVRASAPGYLAQEITVIPTPDPGPLTATVIELSKIQTP